MESKNKSLTNVDALRNVITVQTDEIELNKRLIMYFLNKAEDLESSVAELENQLTEKNITIEDHVHKLNLLLSFFGTFIKSHSLKPPDLFEEINKINSISNKKINESDVKILNSCIVSIPNEW